MSCWFSMRTISLRIDLLSIFLHTQNCICYSKQKEHSMKKYILLCCMSLSFLDLQAMDDPYSGALSALQNLVNTYKEGAIPDTQIFNEHMRYMMRHTRFYNDQAIDRLDTFLKKFFEELYKVHDFVFSYYCLTVVLDNFKSFFILSDDLIASIKENPQYQYNFNRIFQLYLKCVLNYYVAYYLFMIDTSPRVLASQQDFTAFNQQMHEYISTRLLPFDSLKASSIVQAFLQDGEFALIKTLENIENAVADALNIQPPPAPPHFLTLGYLKRYLKIIDVVLRTYFSPQKAPDKIYQLEDWLIAATALDNDIKTGRLISQEKLAPFLIHNHIPLIKHIATLIRSLTPPSEDLSSLLLQLHINLASLAAQVR